jgi:hypothetical protein
VDGTHDGGLLARAQSSWAGRAGTEKSYLPTGGLIRVDPFDASRTVAAFGTSTAERHGGAA